MTEVPWADAIINLRLELQRAPAAAADSPLRFEIDSVVLEIEVALPTSAFADAKLGLWNVVSVSGGGAARAQGSKHRVTPVRCRLVWPAPRTANAFRRPRICTACRRCPTPRPSRAPHAPGVGGRT